MHGPRSASDPPEPTEVAARLLFAMHDQIRDETIRKRREGHGAIMLVVLLMVFLLAGTALVAFENAAVFKAAAPPDSPLKSDEALPAAPL